jgi:hypothetical protein
VDEAVVLRRDAVIAAEKLRDYILSPVHPDGCGKADYLAKLGYSQANWKRLAFDLRVQVLSHPATPARVSPYGRKYEILAPLKGPNGKTAWIRTIWIVLKGQQRARLVTVLPEARP